MADGDIQYPSGFSYEDIAGWGTTGMVVLDKASNTVIKTPHDHGDAELLTRERQIYERFTKRGGHPGILSYYGTFDSGIRLQFASNYHLLTFNKKNPVSSQQRLRWAIEIVEAVDFMHRAGVIHGDLTLSNILLDENLNVKLTDFAGSSLDGSELLIAVTASYEFPGPLLSIQADLFALGSVLYELFTKDPPYKGRTEKEIECLYRDGEFPDTTSIGTVGRVITNCWQTKYTECGSILKDLKGISLPSPNATNPGH
ncbi:kinase-like protein [Nemania abortiva]|nr:kinase-like protein [Nemania abortiva]